MSNRWHAEWLFWRSVLLWATSAALVLPALGLAAEWGDLSGRFIYDGEPPQPKVFDTSKEPTCPEVVDETLLVGDDGGLANVVIFVSSKNIAVHPDFDEAANETAVVKIKGCRFDPHIIAMRFTQTLEIVNDDAFSHNASIHPLGDAEISPILTPGNLRRTFHKAQNLPVPVDCNIHPWERGYVVIKDHPYVGITDRSGEFQIKQLPAGELEFRVWHERAGWLRAKKEWGKQAQFKLKIKSGENSFDPIKVAPQLLERR